MSVEDGVKGVLLEILDIEEKDIVPGAHLMTDLDASSVDLVEIIAGIENEFNIQVSDEDAPKLRTIQTLMDYVRARVA